MLMLLKDVRRSEFVGVGTAGYAILAAAFLLCLYLDFLATGLSLDFFVSPRWIGAFLGLYAGVTIQHEAVLKSETTTLPDPAR